MATPVARNPKHRKNHSSTAIASLFVAAAGVIAWFGLSGSQSPVTEPAEAVTIAGYVAPDQPVVSLLAGHGSLPTRVVVPSAGIDTMVSEVGIARVEGKLAWQTAWRSAGHHIDSARPGQPGNMVLTGHVSVADSSNLAVFKSLDRVKPGDTVEVQSGDNSFTYVVAGVQVVDPTAVKLLRSDHRSTVTLITCTPDLKKRLVVTGTLQTAT